MVEPVDRYVCRPQNFHPFPRFRNEGNHVPNFHYKLINAINYGFQRVRPGLEWPYA